MKTSLICFDLQSACFGRVSNPFRLIALGFCLAATSLLAQSTDTWLGYGSANFSGAGNWTPQNPVSGDSLVFNTVNGFGPVLNDDLTGAPEFAAITFNSGASGWTIGGNVFTLGTNTADTVITVSSANAQVINDNITLGNAVQTINTASGNLTLGGNLSGAGSGSGIYKSGGSTLTLNGVNTFAGGMTINAGTVAANTSQAFGTGMVSNNATIYLTNGMTVANALAITGGFLGVNGSVTNGSATWSNNIYLYGGVKFDGCAAQNNGVTMTLGGGTVDAFILTNASASAIQVQAQSYGTVVFNCTVGGVFTQLKDGANTGGGSWRFNSTNNTFTTTTVPGFYTSYTTMYANNIASNGYPCSLGSGTTNGIQVIQLGGLGYGFLDFTGAGGTSDRILQIASTGNLSSDGTGPVRFTSNVTNIMTGATTFTLGGTNNGELDGNIPNSTSGQTPTTANILATTNKITLASVIGIITGATISGAGPAAGTTITAINGNVVTLSANTTNTATINSGGLMTIPGVANPLSLTKAGTGTWTLTASNTYAGVTTVNAGTLLVNGSIGTNTVTVNNAGSAFGGTGSNYGPVTFNSGTFAQFTLGSPFTMSKSLAISGGTTPAVRVNLTNNVPAGTYTLATYNTTGSSGAFSAVPLILNGSLAAGNVATIATSGGNVTLTVQPQVATTVTVTSSSNPSIVTSNVIFTATIAPASGSVVPTGTIQFQTNGVNMGAPLTVTTGVSPNGIAAISTANLPVGTTIVTAQYVSNSIVFIGSTGTLAGGQVVNASVTTPPNFSSGGVSLLPGGGISLVATGALGGTYKLWASTNLALTPFTNHATLLQSGTITTSPFTNIDLTATNYPQRFYLFTTP